MDYLSPARYLLTVLLAIVTLAPSVARADVPMPAVNGPISYSVGAWGFPYLSIADPAELTAVGYTEEEFFFSGTVLTQAGAQPYVSRMLVRRPMDPKRFNGTVVVEWLNVTAGGDIAVDWGLTRRQILRGGYAYVGVTAQPVGVCWLKTWDAVRYGDMTHPALPPGPCPASNETETYSYDIFSQAGKALRDNPLVLGGLEVKRLIAIGASQSARRLRNYINAYQATAQIYDGLLIHVLSNGGLITNTSTPVLILDSEREVLAYYPYRGLQPANVRYWEVAGAGHTPDVSYLVSQMQHAGITLPYNLCDDPPSDDFIPIYPVGDAALHALNRWIVEGVAPTDSPVVTVIPVMPDPIARDQYGNAIGGIRLPQIEVPIARFIGTNGTNVPIPSAILLCRTSGGVDLFDGEPAGTTPNDIWNEPTIEQLYANHGSYVAAFVQAVDALVQAGFMLEQDAQIAKTEAAHRKVGK